jgi:hypothetical protein
VLGRVTVGVAGAEGAEPRTSGLEDADATDSVALVDSIATAENV